MSKITASALELIGGTPLLKADRYADKAGVKDATLSFMTLKLKVEFEDGADVDVVMQEAVKNCKKVEDDCEIFL